MLNAHKLQAGHDKPALSSDDCPTLCPDASKKRGDKRTR